MSGRLCVTAFAAFLLGPSIARADSALTTAALYNRVCAPCHGVTGNGAGPAGPWLWPRPRDFTQGQYKWRTTPLGASPALVDVIATIRYGAPGTSMPAFHGILSEDEITALARHVLLFANLTASSGAQVPEPPAGGSTARERGKQAFERNGCTTCHGQALTGDGAVGKALLDAKGLPAGPYDFTQSPLRRPRLQTSDARSAVFLSISYGIAGTSMASYGSLPVAERWAIAEYLAPQFARPSRALLRNLAPLAIAADAKSKLTTAGYWPGHGEVGPFADVLTVQGPAPAHLAPAQASLSSQQCARCHADRFAQWQGSLHALASSPGLLGQTQRLEGKNDASVESCQRCHSPLAEQLARTRPAHHRGDATSRTYAANPAFREALRAEGITCAACHVRNHERWGPGPAPGRNLLPLPNYPTQTLAVYERSDFCLPCHQLPARQAVAGRPLLNTYVEWLNGPYMPRGVQCQHCHMPNRDHTFKGIHDKTTVLQAYSLETLAVRVAATGTVNVRVRMHNVGAGHYMPTTPTPAMWLEAELVDSQSRPIAGAQASLRIGRKLNHDGRQFSEVEDTRIPPGETRELAAAWRDGQVAQAKFVRIRLRVHPDDYYEGLYVQRLKTELPAQSRKLFEQAYARAIGNRYVAEERLVAITDR